MGLKCSVIGHKYGDAAVEREREEQGSEVVITIQERETCERCGKTRVVSENKEVTAIETPSDIAGDMLDEESGEAEPAADTGEADDGDGVAGAAAEREPPEADAEMAADESAVEPVDPDADDAEILDADDDEQAAGGDSELENPSTEVSIADAENEPPLDAEAAAAQDPESDDGVIIDAEEDASSVRTERKPGEWPEEPSAEAEDDWAPDTGVAEPDEETVDYEPFGGSAVTVPNGQFRCPECEFTTEVASSSLRAGDFCPECQKGALVHSGE